MTPSDPNPDPLVREAISCLLDGKLNDGDFEWLEHQLRNDAAARDYYFQSIWLETALDAAHAAPISSGRRPFFQVLRRGMPVLASAAAAVALIALFLFFKRDKPEAGGGLRFCEGSEWTMGGQEKRAGRLSYGSEVRLTKGVAEVTLKGTVAAVIEAPATFSLQDAKTFSLVSGSGVFRVDSAAGHGFTVVTPNQKIVDLGTEFGVRLQAGQAETELQVFQGKVEVPVSGGSGERPLLQTQGAVLLKGASVLRTLEADESRFLRKLPAGIQVLLRDDFERGLKDDEVVQDEVRGWQCQGQSGTFNPGGNGRWYARPELADSGSSGGAVEGMAGPSLAFFYAGASRNSIRRGLGVIEADTTYSVSLVIGVRSADAAFREQFDGYTVQLVSNGVVLAGMKSDKPPGPPDSFTRVGFTWDSASPREAAAAGGPLEIRITPNGAVPGPYRYLDFDDVKVTAIKRAAQ